MGSTEKQAEAEGTAASTVDDAQPPPYGDTGTDDVDFTGEGLDQLHLGFSASPSTAISPTSDACLAHLKLLFAFYALKSRVGLQDGLWDIWDTRAQRARTSDDANSGAGPEGASIDLLALLREKRWAIYVARAVDRYATWWKSFVPNMLKEADMLQPGKNVAEGTGSERYVRFTAQVEPMRWTSGILPPLDVLLVWHAHMLNPRLFLEDCLRYGYHSLWSAGIPWELINRAINPAFQYLTSDECELNWVIRTGTPWKNEECAAAKTLKCPACGSSHEIPWTTCGQPRDTKEIRKPGVIGQGYGDGQLNWVCNVCNLTIDHDALRLAKFRDDAKNLVTLDWALPGTILDTKTGFARPQSSESNQLFPSRLVRRGLLVDVAGMLKPGTSSSVKPSMYLVRDRIQKVSGPRGFCEDPRTMKTLGGDKEGLASFVVPYKLHLDARVQVRKMMSRYWNTSSPFGLDLCGAVLRQAVFTDKMFKINWLQSPAAKHTMDRLLTKYDRFFHIIAAFPNDFAVPTLDVDLAWHTHQLSPKRYYDFSVCRAGSFVDHNDQVDEDKLGSAFEWTCKIYLDRWGEVYSECTCWFCETLRFIQTPAGGKMFGAAKQQKVIQAWRASGAAQASVSESVHISSHPAVQAAHDTRSRRRVMRRLFLNGVDDGYARALKKEKEETAEPKKSFFGSKSKASDRPSGSRVVRMARREDIDACDHWGKRVVFSGPWASQVAAALNQAMYATPPGVANTGPHEHGVCAVGTCGGSGGCGSGFVAMCGAGCTGSGLGTYDVGMA